MKPLTVAAVCGRGTDLSSLTRSSLFEEVIPLAGEGGGMLLSGRTVASLFERARTPYLLLLHGAVPSFVPSGLGRLVSAAEQGAAIVYSDYLNEEGGKAKAHPLADYQPGSVRDDFDFGPAVLFSVRAAREAARKHGPAPDVAFAGLYDLRLKLSIDGKIVHLNEPLYSVPGGKDGESLGLFAYLHPRNEAAQKEMELVFTDHLKRIGAYIAPGRLAGYDAAGPAFPVEASVVIPVLNRAGTIADAVASALSQETDFPFNVIVVDNHSTDGTTSVLASIAAREGSIRHIVPERTGLAIGGCWNEALADPSCGRYAVQLDSDDLYRDATTLGRIVRLLRRGCAMVIGAYTLCDFDLNEIPPGLIDHREWTDENGHNNALRVNGLGAPRAFATALVRRMGFPDVSYGEDYAVSLRICREYRVARIYDSIYLCRRWPGNTDASLDQAATNRNNTFKDGVRTEEIRARQKAGRAGG